MPNQNDFLDRILSMSSDETIAYATAHGMTLEALQDLFAELIMDIDDEELDQLAKRHGIDDKKVKATIDNAIRNIRAKMEE